MLLKRIKELAKSKKISLSKLEEDLNIAKNSLYKIEQSDPSISKIIAIADYFQVSIDYLTGRDTFIPKGNYSVNISKKVIEKETHANKLVNLNETNKIFQSELILEIKHQTSVLNKILERLDKN